MVFYHNPFRLVGLWYTKHKLIFSIQIPWINYRKLLCNWWKKFLRLKIYFCSPKLDFLWNENLRECLKIQEWDNKSYNLYLGFIQSDYSNFMCHEMRLCHYIFCTAMDFIPKRVYFLLLLWILSFSSVPDQI